MQHVTMTYFVEVVLATRQVGKIFVFHLTRCYLGEKHRLPRTGPQFLSIPAMRIYNAGSLGTHVCGLIAYTGRPLDVLKAERSLAPNSSARASKTGSRESA